MKGFTLLEILLVLAMIAIIFAISPPLYTKLVSQSALDSDISTLVSVLRKAESNSLASSYNSSWGVQITNSKYTLFKGDSYENRDKDFDEDYNFYEETTVSGSSSIVFAKANYELGTSSISLSNAEDTKIININNLGLISY